ncbi:katanin p80 WD40 repeat-containing subunit B1 isoform X2 [Frankliniella occidentalis]|uniref:Katanin p80 WD40 repeat-containing subunit B1 n=1 Tax=Frankliniella occidentalis TaxID=133901 RepID=A0A6J1RRY9_FRAOC|nr:katanin p80 WD40 repeat-containing subunit B1 isoform X2 [Frankliniella occidentalis]
MAISTKRSWKLQDFVAHSANVNCLALGHKSGRVLVTGGDDKKVNLWAVGKHNCIISLSGHTTPVECVRFGHTEELVCAGSQTGALKIWDLEAVKIVRTLTGHKSAIRCMDFHPYGDFLASGSTDASIKLWDTRRKGCIFTYGHKLTVNSLKFSPDGQWIASGGDEGIVRLWDIRAGKVLKEFAEHSGAVTSVEFHPHEFLLASGSVGRSVNFWDLENFQLVSSTERDGGSVRCLYFSQGGECLFAASPECLRVCGWEPSRIYDSLAVGWGKVADIATAQNQLIGASFHMMNVALFVVDLKKVQPFGGPVINPNDSINSSPFRHGQSARKSFSKETQLNLSKPPMSVRTIEENDRSETDPEDETVSHILDVKDYEAIFLPNRSSSHSSPSHSNASSLTIQEGVGMPQIIQPLLPMKVSRNSPEPSEQMFSGTGDCVDPNDSPDYYQPQPIHLLPEDDSYGDQIPEPQPRQRRPSQLSPVRQRSEKHSPVLSGSARSKGSSPTPVASHRMSYREDTHSSFDNDFPVKLSSIRHSPSEPALNRPNAGHSRSSSLSRNSVVANSSSTGNIKQIGSSNDVNSSTSGFHIKHSITPGFNLGTDVSVSYLGKNSTTTPSSKGALPMVAPRTKVATEENLRRQEKTSVDVLERQRPPVDDEIDDIIPISMDKPSNLDLEDFLPNRLQRSVNFYQQHQYLDMSEAEVLSSIMRGHESMMTVMNGRHRSLQIIYSLWHNKDLKVAVDTALEMNDLAIVVDLLGILTLRPSIWNLDLCVSLLDPIHELLQSKYEMYMTVGCNTLRLILRNFSSLIKTNVQAPIHTVGVDISREERYNKCMKCYESLQSIRSFLLKRQTVQGKLGHTFREITILMQSLDN